MPASVMDTPQGDGARAAAPAPSADARARIVFCSAAVGSGHTKAAHAVRDALALAAPETGTAFVEALDHAPAWFTFGYRDGYLRAIAAVPPLAGLAYRLSDRAQPKHASIADRTEARALRAFLEAPEIRGAEVIFTSHFLCARVLSRAKQRGSLTARLAVCVTDQHPHGVWLTAHADRVFVASDAARSAAVSAGLLPERVEVTGIPVDPRFGRLRDVPREDVRRALGLPLDRPTVLFTGGGLGLGGIEAAVRAFLGRAREAHAVVVCGKNEALVRKLEGLSKAPEPRKPSCTVMGFTSQMPELMHASSVYVGKPGGLSTAECCAAGLPMILLRPIPGQEEHNATLLSGAEAAIAEPDARRAGVLAAELAMDDARRTRMRHAGLALGRADAAATLAQRLLSLAEMG